MATSGTRTTQIRVLSQDPDDRVVGEHPAVVAQPDPVRAAAVHEGEQRGADRRHDQADGEQQQRRQQEEEREEPLPRLAAGGAAEPRSAEAATSCASRRRANQAGTDVEQQEQTAHHHDEGDQPVHQHEELRLLSGEVELHQPSLPGPATVGGPARDRGPGHRRDHFGQLLSMPLEHRRGVLAVDPVDHALPERPRADGGRHQVGAVEAEDAASGPAGSGRRACRSGSATLAMSSLLFAETQSPSLARLLAYSPEAR